MSFLAIIGCGRMGTAFAKGWANKQAVRVWDRHPEKCLALKKEFQVEIFHDIKKEIGAAEYVVICVKPQDAEEIASFLRPLLSKKTCLLSILSGIPLTSLQSAFPDNPVVRLMPTLTIGQGMGVIAVGESSYALKQKNALQSLLAPFGKLFWLPEHLIDAFTALIGSGPGYICLVIEAFVEAGIALGFSPHQALAMVTDMIKGTMHSLQADHVHPGEFKWQISSPQGNTIQGLREMEKRAVSSGIMEGILAGFSRIESLHRKNS